MCEAVVCDANNDSLLRFIFALNPSSFLAEGGKRIRREMLLASGRSQIYLRKHSQLVRRTLPVSQGGSPGRIPPLAA